MRHSLPGEVIRFGPFELDPNARVLRKHGVRVRLQAQPFQILKILVENPGRVVTREELRQCLWPSDTFVDFEHGLNTAMTRVRQALGDSAATPQFIETIPKVGYRFCLELEQSPLDVGVPAVGKPSPTRNRPVHYIVAGSLILAALGGAGYGVMRRGATLRFTTPVPVTSFRGDEANPALSPDGSRLSFAWNGENRDNFDIYVTPLGSNAPTRLTTHRADDLAPSWSPDGRLIAFVRRLGGVRGELLLVPANGGPEQKIGEVSDVELRQSPGRMVSLAWSPDGRAVAASHRQPADQTERIYLFSLSGGLRPMTSTPGLSSDHLPAISPDGRTLAYCRMPGWSASEIYVQPLGWDLEPSGRSQSLTGPGLWAVHPRWLPSGDRILYVSAEEPSARHALRIMPAFNKGAGETIPIGDQPVEIAVVKDRLVYSKIRLDTNIWRARISLKGGAPSEARMFIGSTWRDDRPKYSPDGQKLAFTSSRSGAQEIWLAKADGSNQVQLTSFGGPLVGYASWSPDGRSIAFHARPEGHGDLFVIPPSGGLATRLTTHAADDTMPSYSQDGRSLLFSSSRSGTMEIWRIPLSGGEPEQLTTTGGIRPIASADGKRIFYNSPDGKRIRSIPVEGGPPVDVRGPLHDYPSAYAVSSRGVYYQTPPQPDGRLLVRFLSFTGEDWAVSSAPHPPFLGMTVSPDDKFVLLDQIDESDRDLMLIARFRP